MQGEGGHPAWCLHGWGAKGDPLHSSARNLEFNLHHWQKTRKWNQPEILNAIHWITIPWLVNGFGNNCCITKIIFVTLKISHHLKLITKSLYLLTIFVKMKDRILAKYDLFSYVQTDGTNSKFEMQRRLPIFNYNYLTRWVVSPNEHFHENRITNDSLKEVFVFPCTNDHIYKYAARPPCTLLMISN